MLANSPDYRVYVLRVWDKFGDYGLTGVVIINVSADRAVWTIDTLLLSCRVLGRGVESALLALLAENARAEGVDEFIASFVPTAKNSLAATFLSDHGFRPDGARWQIAAADAPILPFFIQHVGHTGRDQQLVPSLAVAQHQVSTFSPFIAMPRDWRVWLADPDSRRAQVQAGREIPRTSKSFPIGWVPDGSVQQRKYDSKSARRISRSKLGRLGAKVYERRRLRLRTSRERALPPSVTPGCGKHSLSVISKPQFRISCSTSSEDLNR